MLTDNTKKQKELDLMIHYIVRELIVEFGKNEKEAIQLVKTSEVHQSLVENPIGFHESPYNWALSILTDHNDVEALEKHMH